MQKHEALLSIGLIANKNARIVWALLSDDREFRPDYIPQSVGV
jgi:hypothetical protein